MNFWELNHPANKIALIDGDQNRVWTYGDLLNSIARLQGMLRSTSKGLGLILCSNSASAVAAYVCALRIRDTVVLLPAGTPPECLDRIIDEYVPDWIVAPACENRWSGYRQVTAEIDAVVFARNQRRERDIYSELAILLSTSGSTGSPKLVRLSYADLAVNAQSICQYLGIDDRECPITSLPMPYSYGLSVINSHLLKGATLLLTNRSVVERQFWDLFRQHGASSLAGVPYTFEILLRTGLLKKTLPSLRTLTQAGGHLDDARTAEVHDIAKRNGWQFFVMYGQTEATARISYVPPDMLDAKIGSIGRPIPGGVMAVDAATGELIYRGPNVMLGYAERESDLARGDDLHGKLRTGDLARQDEDGFFYLTGRTKRMVKIFSQRLNLDEIETLLRSQTGATVACIGTDDNLVVAVEAAPTKLAAVADILTGTLRLHRGTYRLVPLERIPHNSRGKIDYSALTHYASACAAL
jgi:long-chain acyl-CoA synthetase